MPLNLVNLDAPVRQAMLEEIERDERLGQLHFSDRLNSRGRIVYAELLKQAARSGDCTSFATSLRAGLLRASETGLDRGRLITRAIPATAAETLADGEFNHFYIRGLCRVAMAQGQAEVEIYRARDAAMPRAGSELIIGNRLSAAALLEDLRKRPGREGSFGVPGGPNSGLSVRLP